MEPMSVTCPNCNTDRALTDAVLHLAVTRAKGTAKPQRLECLSCKSHIFAVMPDGRAGPISETVVLCMRLPVPD